MKISHFISTLLIAVFILAACTPKTSATAPESAATSAPENSAQTDYTGKKIVWINSYHEGYPWSDGIEKACIRFWMVPGSN